MIGIYRIRNIQNDKCYIGSSRNLKARFYGHKWLLRKNKHPNIHLQRAWNLCGEDSFVFDVIMELSSAKRLREVEQSYLESSGALSRGTGYNISPRADCRAISRETAERIGAANRGKFAKEGNPFWGKKHTEETKEKIRRIHLGTKLSMDTRRKMSEQRKGEKHWAFGRKYSDEARARMSASMVKLKKPVGRYSFEGNLLEEFGCIKDVVRKYGYGRTTISGACRGKIRYAYGYKWQYLTEGLMKGSA